MTAMGVECTTERLIGLRRLTRAVADLLRARMKVYVGTLAPLLRPRPELAEYVPSGIKGPVRGVAKTFDDLAARYEAVARARPFNLLIDLKAPLGAPAAGLDMTPLEYVHVATVGNESKRVRITSPLTWMLTPSGFDPERLRGLLRDQEPDRLTIQRFIVQYLLLDLMLGSQPGIGAMLAALHFPLEVRTTAEFGDLPVAFLVSDVPTVRPPDPVIVDSTEISGEDVFQEIVDTDAILGLRDPLREEIVRLLRSHGEPVPDGDG